MVNILAILAGLITGRVLLTLTYPGEETGWLLQKQQVARIA
jgi:hypothetical protein